MGNCSGKKQSNEQEMVWEKCYQLFIQAENGNNESFKELEEISKNNQNDVVCLGYYLRLMREWSEFRDQEKIQRTIRQIREIISNLKSNSSSFKHFIQNLSNKHQQFVFGYFFSEGIGVELSSGESFKLMKLSSDQGHVIAEFLLGYSYENGDGVERNEELAFEWFKRSADHGYREGCYFTGRCYFYGRGAEMNEEEAIKWFELAADKEHWYALFIVGLLYHYGRIVERDRNKSIQLFETLIDLQGSSDAKYYLGVHFLQDESDPPNQTKGFRIFNEIQYPNAKLKIYIGLCYEFGLGVEKCERKAFELYSQASDQSPLQRYNFGRCYEEGIGVEVNEERARRKFEEAADEGNIDAKNKLRELEEDKVKKRFRFRSKVLGLVRVD